VSYNNDVKDDYTVKESNKRVKI